jgi:hypothetical protein
MTLWLYLNSKLTQTYSKLHLSNSNFQTSHFSFWDGGGGSNKIIIIIILARLMQEYDMGENQILPIQRS